jgi:glycosyltransferase involved in cell wall biosynthesis
MIIYLGHYVSEKVCTSRGLPTLNAAGTNRMQRIAEALVDAGERCLILSSGSAARLKWSRQWFHRGCMERKHGVSILYAATVGIPYLSVFFSQLAILCALFGLRGRRDITGIIVYNFQFINLIVACVGRYIFKVPVLLDLEDVSIPKWNDLLWKSETSPFQQMRLWPLMKATILTCHAVFGPTRRFREVVPLTKPFEVISGCMRISPTRKPDYPVSEQPINDNHPVVILFSGKIEFEHGVELLANAIGLLDVIPTSGNYVFQICGSGGKLAWLREKLKAVKRVKVNVYGFVSNQEYSRILEAAEICLALQNPTGRHATYKTPSKGYEAMCCGKVLLVSVVGDFGNIPDEACLKVFPYTAEQLVKQISQLTRTNMRDRALNAQEYARSNWGSSICGERIKTLLRQSLIVV